MDVFFLIIIAAIFVYYAPIWVTIIVGFLLIAGRR